MMEARTILAALIFAGMNHFVIAGEVFISQPTAHRSPDTSIGSLSTSMVHATNIATPIALGSFDKSISSGGKVPQANMTIVSQMGTNNFATVGQSGSGNLSSIIQRGAYNQAIVTQMRGLR